MGREIKFSQKVGRQEQSVILLLYRIIRNSLIVIHSDYILTFGFKENYSDEMMEADYFIFFLCLEYLNVVV